MSDKLKIIRVFIGSPGGLEEEREAAHRAVNSVNHSHSERWGILFKLLGWENAVPGYIRPQAKINEDLDKCDYFIGVLWNKWGSRPSTDPGGYTSGFEEEYLRAEKRIKDGLMRDMAIYFKDIEVPPGMEPGEDIKKVLNFRQKCIDEKIVFFKNFNDANAFREVVREKLEEIGWRETEILSTEDQQLNQPKKTRPDRDDPSEPPPPNRWLLDEEARNFLNELTQRSPDWDGTSPQEVARLRLIGTAVRRSGNDDFYLGNHDANLIFQYYRSSALSGKEVRALIECGVVGFQHQNVPLWRWLARSEEQDIWGTIRILALVGNDTEKRYAIEILSLGSESIPSIEPAFDKNDILIAWLSDETSSQVFDAAVSFLASNGDKDELHLVEEVAARCAPHRRAKVEAAIVGILSRTHLEAALRRLVEKELDKIDANLAGVLFGSPQSLATETMVSCLSAKSESIRLRAVQVLFERNEITLAAAETLLTDSNHEIRLLAAESLRKMGAGIDDDVAKKALRIVKPGSTFGALFSRNETDETYYERYLANRLAELDLFSLRAKANAAGVFDERELSVLYAKYPSKMLGEIRQNLNDCFKSHLDNRIRDQVDAGDLDPERVSKLRNLESFMRKRHCDHALNVLCGMGKPEDLNLVRSVLKQVEVDATESILNYLARFGRWSDIEGIKRLGDYPSSSRGLLDFKRTDLAEEKARAIFALGKGRVADMLALDLDNTIRLSLAKLLPKKAIVELRDEVLLRELARSDEEYRIVFALKCVQTLSKSRVETLLNLYVGSGEHRFYNSIHWLDLGAALPSALAKRVAVRALSRH